MKVFFKIPFLYKIFNILQMVFWKSGNPDFWITQFFATSLKLERYRQPLLKPILSEGTESRKSPRCKDILISRCINVSPLMEAFSCTSRKKTPLTALSIKRRFRTSVFYPVFFLSFLNSFLIPILFPSLVSSAEAGLGAKLEGVFRNMGYATNVTKGGAYRDQQGGYITGGSLFARAPVANHSLANFQAPSFGWGCGGVDLFTGSISFISKEDLVNTLRTIGSNAMSYAYGLALQQVTPQIKAVIDNLQATMQEINNANINSCRMAAQLVGGMAPKTQASTELYCSSKGLNLGKFSDYADAKHQCQKPGSRGEVNRETNVKDEFKQVLGDEFNLAWLAIKGNKFLSEDQETAEFILSLSGSIIARIDPGKDSPTSRYLPSLATRPEFLKILVGARIGEKETSAKIQLYQCDEEKECLNPSLPDEGREVSKNNTFLQKVRTMTDSIYEKVLSDEESSPEEQGFINSTSIPVLRILAINAAYKNDTQPIAISELAEVIAYDILLRYVESVLDLVLEHMMQLKNAQITDTSIKEFKDNIGKTQRLLLSERRSLLHHMQASIAVIERTKQMEEYVYNKFIGGNVEDLHD